MLNLNWSLAPVGTDSVMFSNYHQLEDADAGLGGPTYHGGDFYFTVRPGMLFRSQFARRDHFSGGTATPIHLMFVYNGVYFQTPNYLEPWLVASFH